MSLIPLIAVILTFTIPILAIALAGYKEWLKFKTKHRELGSSTREIEQYIDGLQDRIAKIEEERDALQKRVENLETIVTSEAWIAQHENTGGESLDAAEAGKLELPPPEDKTDADRTAGIARQIRDQ